MQGDAGDEHPLGITGLREDSVAQGPEGHANEQRALSGQVVEGERQEQQENDFGILPNRHDGLRIRHTTAGNKGIGVGEIEGQRYTEQERENQEDHELSVGQ